MLWFLVSLRKALAVCDNPSLALGREGDRYLVSVLTRNLFQREALCLQCLHQFLRSKGPRKGSYLWKPEIHDEDIDEA